MPASGPTAVVPATPPAHQPSPRTALPTAAGPLQLALTWPAVLAGCALVFVGGEAHELAHTGLGWLLCGNWGPRDANTWQLACSLPKAAALAVQWAGPLLTYCLVWLGYGLMGQWPAARRSVGLALVFTSLPLARLLGSAMGGNDEVNSLKRLLPLPAAWLLGALLAIVLLGPPLWRAYRLLRSPALFTVALVLPVLLSWVVVHKGFNALLAHGILARRLVLGEPLVITCWTALLGGVLLLTGRHLASLFQPAPNEPAG